MASPPPTATPPGQQDHSATALPQHSAPATSNHPTQPRIQRAVPIHRPAASTAAAPLPLPMAFRAPAARRLPAGRRSSAAMTDFLSAAVSAQARDTRGALQRHRR